MGTSRQTDACRKPKKLTPPGSPNGTRCARTHTATGSNGEERNDEERKDHGQRVK